MDKPIRHRTLFCLFAAAALTASLSSLWLWAPLALWAASSLVPVDRLHRYGATAVTVSVLLAGAVFAAHQAYLAAALNMTAGALAAITTVFLFVLAQARREGLDGGDEG
jgi:hypothetical protein